jgi:protein-disulfide isomerase
MTSGKKARQRRTPAPPPVRSTGGRRASPKVLAAAAIVIALVAVGAALAFALTGGGNGGSSSTAGPLPGSTSVLAVLRGIPQQGNVLGKPSAPVTMVEYIDLQCPNCRTFEIEVMPTIIRRYVRTGKVKVVAKPLAFITPAENSQRGRLAALAAGRQDRFFDFAQLVYANQGTEGTDWLTDDFVRSVYKSIPGFHVQRALSVRNSSALTTVASDFDQQATADNVGGTPTILIGTNGGKFSEVTPGFVPSVAQLEAALNRALR